MGPPLNPALAHHRFRLEIRRMPGLYRDDDNAV